MSLFLPTAQEFSRCRWSTVYANAVVRCRSNHQFLLRRMFRCSVDISHEANRYFYRVRQVQITEQLTNLLHETLDLLIVKPAGDKSLWEPNINDNFRATGYAKMTRQAEFSVAPHQIRIPIC